MKLKPYLKPSLSLLVFGASFFACRGGSSGNQVLMAGGGGKEAQKPKCSVACLAECKYSSAGPSCRAKAKVFCESSGKSITCNTFCRNPQKVHVKTQAQKCWIVASSCYASTCADNS